MTSANHPRAGFGAFEVVIVVAILGFAFLMALKGRELVHKTRGIVTAGQLRGFQDSVRRYEDQYRALPGDDPSAPRKWRRTNSIYLVNGVTVSSTGDQRIQGKLSDYGNATGEQFNAWRDLRFAGMVTGDTELVGQSAMPENSFGGAFGFAEDNFGLRDVICATQIPGAAAEMIDQRLDDGIIATGNVRATSRWDPLTALNRFEEPDATAYDPSKTYIICVPQRV